MEVWGGRGYRGIGAVKKEAVEIYETTSPKNLFLKKISHPVHTSPLYNIKYQTAVNQIIPTGPPTFEKPENTFTKMYITHLL